MAIKITAYNANNDSSGIDLNAYFADIEINYSPVGYGYFSSGHLFRRRICHHRTA